jgi:thioredoxin:protein disulfide reductase
MSDLEMPPIEPPPTDTPPSDEQAHDALPPSMTPASSTRTVSAWWLLALLPVGLGVGLLVGRIPVDPAPAPTTRAQDVATNVARAEEPAVSTTPSASDAWTGAPADEQAQEAKPAQPVELSNWTSLQDAFEESKRNGKPIMIDFSADWCGPCQQLKAQVFESSAHWDRVRGAVIPVSIVDRTREDGSNPPEIVNLQKRFGVDAFPTVVVFSPETGRVMRTQGFGDANATTQWITQSAASVR